MIRFTRSQVEPIGLDIGHDSIKMLQVEVVGNSLSVVAAARMPFADEVKADSELRLPAAVEMIRQMLRHNGFSGRRIVAALPAEILHIKNLRLPPMPAAELPAAIKFEARNIFPFDTEQSRIHYLPAGEVRQGNDLRHEVLVMAACNSDINSFLEQLHRCGVAVASLDVETCALYRSVERFIRRREDEQQVFVLVDVGFRQTQVVIGRGRDITFYKLIDIGGEHLQQAVSGKLGITVLEAAGLRRRLAETPAASDGQRDPVRQAVYDATRPTIEQLGREISLCLRYYSVTFRGQRPNGLRLVGGEACDVSLQDAIKAMLGIPVEPARPLFSVDTSRMKAADRQGTMSGWAVALGLALKCTTGYFGARDGKPRDPAVPTTPPRTAEVVDLDKALAAVGEPLEPQTQTMEAVHA